MGAGKGLAIRTLQVLGETCSQHEWQRMLLPESIH
jgi:hypothetical protein